MKQIKRIAVLLTALALLLACLPGFGALAADRITTTGSVHLRRGPGLDYKSICTIGEGTRLTYTKTSVDDRGVLWYRVTYDGEKGWVSSVYAQEGTGGGSDNRVTTTGNVHLRAGAGADYASRTIIDAGTTLTYDKTDRDEDGVLWYHVSYRDKTGWISSRYANRGGGSASGQVTTTGDVHLRTGAGLDYASRDTIEAGTTLSYDRTERDERGVTWYHVTYDGQKGWISSRYASKGGSASGERVRMTGNANVRTGPGLDYSTIGTVDEGTTLTYKGKSRRDERGVIWYNVSYRGESGDRKSVV